MENVKKMARLFGLIFMIVAFVCAPAFADVCPPGYGYYDKYTKLEYIESTGTQYIDTGKKANQITKWELVAKFNDLLSVDNNFVGNGSFGASVADAEPNRFDVGITTGNKFWLAMGACLNTTIPADTNKHAFVLDKSNSKIFVDTSYVTCYSSKWLEQQTNVWIFARSYYANDVKFFVKENVYSSKMWNGDILVQHLIPARRHADGVLGLYDIVNDVFYANSGTGEFIAGPEVANGGFETMCFPCEPNTYKSESGNTECTPCPDTLVSASGSTDINDCGRVLHLGDNNVFFLRGNRQTTPALHVRDNDGNEWYGNLYQKQ